jgi:hypothetical protein
LQFEAISKAKIEAFLQAKQEEERNPRPSPVSSKEEGRGKSSPATSARDTKASTQVCTSTAYHALLKHRQEHFPFSYLPSLER